jgi:hypothetical protein
MAIDDRHEQYEASFGKWQRMRDVLSGQDRIHEEGKKYLPRLSGQSNDEYNAYKGRALFYGATSRTHSSLVGMVFRKDPLVDLPPTIERASEDIALSGVSLNKFANELVKEDVAVGRVGVLVDHPQVVDGSMSVAVAEASNVRPFLKIYKAEDIFNWSFESINNVEVLTQVRLWEDVLVRVSEFKEEKVKQIRVLDFNDFGQYRQRVFRQDEKDENEWIQFGEDIIPLKDGAPLNFIPFIVIGADSLSFDVDKPPLLDLADANLSHYMTTADLEHGAHFTGLPTAVISGVTEDPKNKKSYSIGSAVAWAFPNPDTKAYYLEFDGQGLGALRDLKKDKEEYMAFLGSRILTPEKRGVEAAQTVALNKAGEDSVLSFVAKSVSVGLTEALQILSEWMNVDSNSIFYELNTDFFPKSMSPQEILALMQLWQSGGLAFDDLVSNLKKGEIVDPQRTVEDIRDDIEQDENLIGGIDG